MSENHLYISYKDAVSSLTSNALNILSIFPEDTEITGKILLIHCMMSKRLNLEHNENDWSYAVKGWIHINVYGDKTVNISDIESLYDKFITLFPPLPEEIVRKQVYNGHDVVKFHGNIEDLKIFIYEHESIIYIRRVSEYDNCGFKIIMNTCSNREISGYLSNQLVDENDLNELVNGNIYKVFKYKCNTQCNKYIGPISSKRDKKLGINYSVEKEIIRHEVIDGHKKLSGKYIVEVINRKDAVNKHVCVDKIKLSFAKEDSMITARVPIISCQKTRSDLIKILSKNRKKIDTLVIDSIKENKTFIKLGIDINWFECSSLVLTTRMELVYTFDIKKGIRNVINACKKEG